MDLLIDTHVLIWLTQDSSRLSRAAREVIFDPANRLFASAVTAWEFADLRSRKRIPAIADFAVVVERLSLRLLDLPAELWRIADTLPNIHGDPTDRTLVAHAIHSGLPLVTADVTMQSYPVKHLW